MEPVRIETARLVLRDWRREDVPVFLRHTNTPAVMRWLGGVMDEDKAATLFERYDGFRAEYGHTFWIVERRTDSGPLAGEILGFCGLKRTDAPGAGFAGAFEIGWRLRQDAWGQGYAREAAEASLDAAFTRFGAEHVNALTVAQNTASWGLMERLGMERAAHLDFVDPRYDPEIAGTIVYSMAAEAWRSTRDPASAAGVER